jgi:hypothetical protein
MENTNSIWICYWWAGNRKTVEYNANDPVWREHLNLLVENGKKPNVVYGSINPEARPMDPVAAVLSAPD